MSASYSYFAWGTTVDEELAENEVTFDENALRRNERGFLPKYWPKKIFPGICFTAVKVPNRLMNHYVLVAQNRILFASVKFIQSSWIKGNKHSISKYQNHLCIALLWSTKYIQQNRKKNNLKLKNTVRRTSSTAELSVIVFYQYNAIRNKDISCIKFGQCRKPENKSSNELTEV